MQFKSLCKDIPSSPLKGAGTILVTGASGYIGGRLVPELRERGCKVRILVRSYPEIYREQWPSVDVAVSDALDYEGLSATIKAAYPIIFSAAFRLLRS